MKYWTKSWNVLYGCTKIRAGCTHCWALQMATRMQGNGLLEGVVNDLGEWTGKIAAKPDRMDMPRAWRSAQVVAVNWMSDTFHENAPRGLWQAMLRVMADTPQHTYLVLTKRYDQLIDRLTPGDAADHIYVGVTISNQTDANDALLGLRFAYDSGWKTWVSYEPALEVVDWKGYEFLDGMVCGGESGRTARIMPAFAAMTALGLCQRWDVPFLFKQWGDGYGRRPAILKGQEWLEFPPKTKEKHVQSI